MIRLIILTDFTETYANNLLKGILAYSKKHKPWVVCKMPISYKMKFGIEGVVEWARRWEANAIIGQFEENDNVQLFHDNGIIAIAQDFRSRFPQIPHITSNYELTGKMGAEYFLQKGYKNYAFYGNRGVVWSVDRYKGFADRIKKSGYEVKYHESQHSRLEDLWFYETESLCQWLLSLPRPIALMACDNNQGSRITEICKFYGIRIPEDISVLGVGNDEIVCNLSHPSLSSIKLQLEKAGYDVAQLIENLVKGRKVGGKDIVINPAYIVSRQSTDIYATADPYILSILKYIHLNIHKKMNVDDIVSTVPLSRRLVEIRFREATQQSIYKYIFNLRLGRFAERLLTTSDPVTEIATSVGLTDYRNLSRQFKAIKGCTPVEYRKKYTMEGNKKYIL